MYNVESINALIVSDESLFMYMHIHVHIHEHLAVWVDPLLAEIYLYWCSSVSEYILCLRGIMPL